jgi:Co/Zn/Cd efflux system component
MHNNSNIELNQVSLNSSGKSTHDKVLGDEGLDMSKEDKQNCCSRIDWTTNPCLLKIAVVSFGLFVIAEIVGSVAVGSLSLLGDGAAMAVDVVTYIFNMYAEHIKSHHGFLSKRATWAFEVGVPLFAVVTLLAVTAWITSDAIKIVQDPPPKGEDDVPVAFLYGYSCANAMVDIICSAFFYARGKDVFYQAVEESIFTKEDEHTHQIGGVEIGGLGHDRIHKLGAESDHSHALPVSDNVPARSNFLLEDGYGNIPDEGKEFEQFNVMLTNVRVESTGKAINSSDAAGSFNPLLQNNVETDKAPGGIANKVEYDDDLDEDMQADIEAAAEADDAECVEMEEIMFSNSDRASKRRQGNGAAQLAGGGNVAGSDEGDVDRANDGDVIVVKNKVLNLNMLSAFTHISADSLRTASVFVAAVVSSATGTAGDIVDAWAAIVVSVTIIIAVIPICKEIYNAVERLRKK